MARSLGAWYINQSSAPALHFLIITLLSQSFYCEWYHYVMLGDTLCGGSLLDICHLI